MARRKAVSIWVQTPQTVQDIQEIEWRMAEARANYVQGVIDKQQYSAMQKWELLQVMIENAQESGKKTP